MHAVLILSLVLTVASPGAAASTDGSEPGALVPGAPVPGAPAPGGFDAPAACRPDRGYRPPVAAPVIDPFRPPPHPFGPGNRGLEYATAPGTAVAAIGAGSVVFAGRVAGDLHVTVGHGDGLRSTYSYLAEVTVTAGDPVGPGDTVGRAGGRLHLGVRCGATYLDPAPLFGGRYRVRLVPDRRFPGTGPSPGSGAGAREGPGAASG